MSGTNLSLAVTGNTDRRFEEYEELLLKRDHLFRVAGSYMTAYTQEFGEQICANFELKVECIKKKKTISYCRRRMNRGLSIDTARMQEEIEQEMTLYHVQLKEILENADAARKARDISEYTLTRAKKIYRRLAKLLHPDINKITSENEDLMELWTRISGAYQKSDVDALDDLEVMVRRALEVLGDDSFKLNVDDIDARIERVENQINEILTTEPYIYRELLNDEDKKQAYREQLREEHDDYEKYLETLGKTLDDMLNEGGIKLVWKMN